MSATYDAAMARLEQALNAPVERRSPVLRELSEERAEHGRPADAIVKQTAVTDAPVETDTITGTFTALVSDYQTDRDNDRFLPGSWDGAIARIRQAGKPLPLLFGHDTSSVNAVIGLVQPGDVWADGRGLWIKGWLDTADQLGQRLYRMVKKGVLTWSVGFSVARKQRGSDGVTELAEVRELYEISATPIPSNPRTATAGMKAVDPDDVPTLEDLRDKERALNLDPETDRIREESRALTLAALRHTSTGDEACHTNGYSKSLAALRAKADRIEREHAPITIASFDC